jgi:hypothetical protein
MKTALKVSAIIILAITIVTMLVLSVLNAQEQYKAEVIQRQNQIEQVANITEETVFETTNQDEANELISEIQKNNKKIIKIDVRKLNPQIKNTPIVITVTYSN